MTITPLRKTVLILALPILGEQLLNSFVGLFDTYLAGDISKAATAAIGLAAYMGWLASMLFMLVGTGTTALIARLTGAGEHADANRIANQSMTLAAITGPAVFVLIYLLAPSFAAWQNMPEETAAIVVTYLRIDAAGLTLTAWTLVGAAALRGVADMRTPMLILGVVNVINVIVSATLVFGLGPFEPMGIHGIVTGTVVARTVGGLITIAVLARGRSGLRLRRHLLTPHWTSIRRIVRIGLPAASDGAIMWTGQFIFLMIIGRLAVGQLGEAYYAAHMIGVRLEALIYLPATAWSMAAATVIGQNLGADQPARAR
ncbi:MAG: MATE family efflux transporter, partial [Planctomycetes bacterium]|nr:MATE family efflux transporter [Planctomycetota bacterium]